MQVLIPAIEIQKIVSELGEQISRDYAGRELLVLGVLKGCFIFMADLLRIIRVPLEVEFITLSSYGDEMKSSGVVRMSGEFSRSLRGRHILVVEDIIDSGLTLNFLMEKIHRQRPASVALASLLVKEKKHNLKFPVDYRGRDIADRFVVGYGLDCGGRYRNLDHIALLGDEISQPSRELQETNSPPFYHLP